MGPAVFLLCVCHTIHINTAVGTERNFRADVLGLYWSGVCTGKRSTSSCYGQKGFHCGEIWEGQWSRLGGWASGNDSQDSLVSPLALSGRWGHRGFPGEPVWPPPGVGMDRGWGGTWTHPWLLPGGWNVDSVMPSPAAPAPPPPLGTWEAGVSFRILSTLHTLTFPEETAPSSQGQASKMGAGVSH